MDRDYRIGIYIRLSLADEDTGYGNKTESDSISNQRMLINRFLDDSPMLAKCPRFEFADDGYTGTNFQRPQFTAMMEKVRSGEINLICVKDFSRFSRDYIETGNYLECTFPFLGVRFISINDGYDSDDYKGTTGGLEVVMRSIIYAAYSKDLSVKTTTAKIQMMKKGKYVGGYAPYGYILHPTIRNKLKRDPEAAEVVRRIFDEALTGRNTSKIARGLNDDGILTPGQYFRSKHPDKKKFSRMSDKVSWTTAMVYKVLTSYVYTGATVGHKRKSCGVGSHKTVAQDHEDWIIVDGMHEAIVSKEEFELAQAVIRGGVKKPQRTMKEYPLKGLVCCGNCKRTMTRRTLKDGTVFYQCGHSTHDRDTECRVGERFLETPIEEAVYNAISLHLSLIEKKAVQNREVGDLRKAAIQECADNIRSLQKQAEQLKSLKLRLYEKYAAGTISREEYIKQKSEADVKLAENDKAIQCGHERMQQLDSEQSCSDKRLDAVSREIKVNGLLTYELAHAFVEAIYVHDHDGIEIAWKFKDIFEETVNVSSSLR
ncbi:MAG: hypothetical protein EUB_02277 [Eubacterium sp.]|uniref:recombinase family protein n=1 Tax=Eubacterium sp. TaxID=142586 RepID=UPI003058A15C